MQGSSVWRSPTPLQARSWGKEVRCIGDCKLSGASRLRWRSTQQAKSDPAVSVVSRLQLRAAVLQLLRYLLGIRGSKDWDVPRVDRLATEQVMEPATEQATDSHMGCCTRHRLGSKITRWPEPPDGKRPRATPTPLGVLLSLEMVPLAASTRPQLGAAARLSANRFSLSLRFPGLSWLPLKDRRSSICAKFWRCPEPLFG
mmetsp:Transcript_52572/g.115305  ORF Transcript_52572/g.115305 Transcript_52572/m.115305 type:complete len:200 (+) Transcript_52572:330-929(+)